MNVEEIVELHPGSIMLNHSEIESMPDGCLPFDSDLDLHSRLQSMPCSLDQTENDEEPYIVEKVVAKNFHRNK